MQERSEKQERILQEWETTDNNILINAVAGSGKTTTLMMLLNSCEYLTLFVAFNKSIQEEIQKRIDAEGFDHGKALTIHSIGLSAIRFSKTRYVIAKNKNWNLVKQIQSKFSKDLRLMPYPEKMRLSFTLIDLNDGSRMYLEDDFEKLKKLLGSMDKNVLDTPLVRTLWEEMKQLRDNSYNPALNRVIEIDFLDMIYLPVRNDLTIPISPYYLMVDEAQDLNLCQHKILDKIISQTVHKWIAVGDKNQAIYGFSGSSSESFDLFLQKKGVTTELPLDICYRSDYKIIEEANKVYPVMIAHSEEPGIVEVMETLDDIKPQSMIICRNSSPLFSVYFELLGLGKICYINGNDLMDNLIRFLRNYNRHTIKTATTEMGYTYQDLVMGTSEADKIKAYFFNENFENFIQVSNHMCDPMDSIETLINNLVCLFNSDHPEAIMLCTIHKSKGLENDVVYILNENLIPSKLARSPEQLKQEQNLRYVARTRAKKEMYYLNLK